MRYFLIFLFLSVSAVAWGCGDDNMPHDSPRKYDPSGVYVGTESWPITDEEFNSLIRHYGAMPSNIQYDFDESREPKIEWLIIQLYGWDGIEVGLREDGVVVWRRKEKEKK